MPYMGLKYATPESAKGISKVDDLKDVNLDIFAGKKVCGIKFNHEKYGYNKQVGYRGLAHPDKAGKCSDKTILCSEKPDL
jgi:hypothetical protein